MVVIGGGGVSEKQGKPRGSFLLLFDYYNGRKLDTLEIVQGLSLSTVRDRSNNVYPLFYHSHFGIRARSLVTLTFSMGYFMREFEIKLSLIISSLMEVF